MVKIYDFTIECLLVITIIFTPLFFGAVHPWAVGTFEIIAAWMFLATVLRIIDTGVVRIVSRSIYFFALLLLLYVFVQSLNFRQLPGTVYVWATKTELLKLVSYFFIFFSVSNLIKTRMQVNRVLFFIIGTGFMMGVFYLLRSLGMSAPKGLINKDHYSGYQAMVACLATGYLFVPLVRSEGDRHRSSPHLLVFFSAMVMALALFCTHSRGGMFSFILALVCMMFLALSKRALREKTWIFFVIVSGILATLLWFGIEPILRRLVSIQVEVATRYFGGRVPIWQTAVGIIRDYPFFGSGLGTFGSLVGKYEPYRMAYHYDHAHCDFLEFYSDLGLAGFLIILILCVLYIKTALSRFIMRHDPFVLGVTVGLFGALASIFVHSFTDFNLRIPSQAILVSILLALSLNVLEINRNINSDGELGFIKNALKNQIFLKAFLKCLVILFLSVFMFFVCRPIMADYYYRHAKNLVKQQGKTYSAIRSLKKAIALDSLNAQYHYDLAMLYKRSFIIKYALSECNEAVRLDPFNSRYCQALALMYDRDDRLARHYFEKAISLEPRNPERYRAYAQYQA